MSSSGTDMVDNLVICDGMFAPQWPVGHDWESYKGTEHEGLAPCDKPILTKKYFSNEAYHDWWKAKMPTNSSSS